MSILFKTQDEVTQEACDVYSRGLTTGSVTPTSWQGYHSYTLILDGQGQIVQFRSKASPLNQDMVSLAKTIHGPLAPTTRYLGHMPGSSVSIWLMEKLPGDGYLTIPRLTITHETVDVTVKDFARFYAASWMKAQAVDQITFQNAHQECTEKLTQLSTGLPDALQAILDCSLANLDDIMRLPWVLTHDDLSDMNILVDSDTGHLAGVVDWADAVIRPFGVALWGLESVLGRSGPGGWMWLSDELPCHRQLFRRTFREEVGGLSDEQCQSIERSRVLGILLRYGFTWENSGMVPTNDTKLLVTFLGYSLFV